VKAVQWVEAVHVRLGVLWNRWCL